ncbi:cytochrome C assembly family protein [Brackiella oedipodis]|uniref:cytochrome C assembly family protein n=1 Tax=Brackiella oedipodis TaxID=124225 RepID=UPI00048F71AB|nr:cytochrome c biogenesis protein CcsA [Brackiella oedipodis]
MSTDIGLHYLAALAYILLGCSIGYALTHNQDFEKWHRLRHWALALTIIVHGFAIHSGLISQHHLHISWSLSLSFTMWLGLIVFWLEGNFHRLDAQILPLSVPATIVCIVAALFPVSHHSATIVIKNEIFRVHLIISLFAYSLIALATIQAICTALLDRHLHKPQNFAKHKAFISRLIDAQPPLLTQEHLLFRLIWTGFILLTLAILTGMWVSYHSDGTLLPFDHKTFFTIIAWAVFAFLLFGRAVWGWRGRLALGWTLTGFVLIMLAYTGTRFVLEVLLS